MQLWLHWWSMVAPLRQIWRDRRSFLWLCSALAGFCVRPDLLGVSSTVRALGLAARHSGTQFMHHQSEPYRAAVPRKLAAYDRHIQIGLIAQGLPQHLAVTDPRLLPPPQYSLNSCMTTSIPPMPSP